MKKLAFSVIFLSVVIAGLPQMNAAAQPAKGTISVMVFNGTPGGDAPAGSDVLLQSASENGLLELGKAKLDSAGITVFNDLDIARPYVVTVTYKNVPFLGELVQFTSGQTSVMSHVSVFESTGDPAVISDAKVAMYINEKDGVVDVTEAHSVTNSSQLAYIGTAPAVGGRFQTVRIGLPSGASVPTYAAGFLETTVQRDGNILTDTRPILPGRKEYAFTYQLVYLSDQLAMTRRFFVPTSRFEVFLPSGVLSMEGAQLTMEEPVEIGGRKLEHYSMSSVATGSALTMTLSNLPYHDSLTLLRNVILIAGAVMGLGFIGWRIRSSRPNRVPVDRS